MRRWSPVLGYVAIGLAVAVLATGVSLYFKREYEAVQAHYIERSAAEVTSGARRLNDAFARIYENLRTLASLPSLRAVDRHGNNLSEEARVTFQQIYNNLASGVAVSEVYIVPAGLDPDRIDPVTGKLEEPILMFDHLILHAGAGISDAERAANPDAIAELAASGPAEEEIHEYRQLTDHASWLQSNYPEQRFINGLRVPMVSGAEVITCDNTDFIFTGKDADRSGVMFSVPFYGLDGKFKGTVSAIILTSALRRLLPDANYVLANPGNNVISMAADAPTHVSSSRGHIIRAKSNPELIFSRVLPVATVDPRSPWFVWAGFDDGRFHEGLDMKALRSSELNAYLTVFGLALAAALGWYVNQRDIAKARVANAELAQARDEAVRAEAEASEMAAMFKDLNGDVTRLNIELAAKVRQLNEAQEDIVRKGKLAQLGQLTATVAHELRNPMGTIRTTAFLLRRKIKGSGLDLEAQLGRIENGISRCDAIITQLLDFARAKKPDLAPVDIDAWLAETVEEEARSIAPEVEIHCDLGLDGLVAAIDAARMRRVVVNLLSNAVEAMVGKDGAPGPGLARAPLVSVATRRTPRGIEIVIADNGPGMTEDVLAKVREPLFTTKSFGTGLGIPAVEKILELHGGGLDIAARPGEGAAFTAWFPTVRVNAEAA